MKSLQTIAEKLNKHKFVAVALLAMLLALFWFFQHREPQKVAAVRPIERIPVSVALLSKAAVCDSFSVVGTVEAFREADIFSESSGLVRRVSAEPGSTKKAGESLFLLDDELATARKRKADVYYRKSKRDAERYKNLYSEGAVALSASETAQLQLEEAEAEFTAASRKYSDTRVKAPFSGMVTARFVEQGELVQEGKRVAQMVDLSKVKVIIFVPERQILKFVPGTLLTVTSDLYQGEGLSGKVSSVSDKAGRDHTFRVEVVLQNSGHIKFRSGMFARVVLKGDGERQALLVPRVALVSGIRNPELFVVRNGKAYLKSFIAGMEVQKQLEVLGGLSAGESVVISGQDELHDGSDVVVIDQKRDPAAP